MKCLGLLSAVLLISGCASLNKNNSIPNKDIGSYKESS